MGEYALLLQGLLGECEAHSAALTGDEEIEQVSAELAVLMLEVQWLRKA